MKTLTIAFVASMIALSTRAQTTQPHVIASGGTVSTKNNIQLEYTVGETVVQTLTKDNRMITQGFHQPSILIARLAKDEILTAEANATQELKATTQQFGELSLNIFPNPTTDYINLKSESNDEMQIALFDANQKMILHRMHQSDSQIDLSKYMAGTYFLVATGKDGKTRNTFRVVKLR